MGARNTIVGIAVILGVLTVSILFLVEYDGLGNVDAGGDADASSDREEAEVLAPSGASPVDGELGGVRAQMRTSIGDPAEDSPAASAESHDVHGVVLDEDGNPAAGVKIAIRAFDISGRVTLPPPDPMILPWSAFSDSEARSQSRKPRPMSSNPNLSLQGSIRIPDRYPPQFTTTSDSTGKFHFDAVFDAPLHRLYFGHNLFLGYCLSEDVTRDGRAQVLRLPDRPTSGLAITLTAEGHALLDPEWLQLEPLALAEEVERGYRKVNAWDVQLLPGKALIHGLAPGRWSVLLRCRSGQVLRREFYVLDLLGLTEVQIRVTETELRPVAGSLAGEFHFDADNTEVKLDASNHHGELDLTDKMPREFGEGGSDKYLGHSLGGFGAGPVAAAFLVLDLEGGWGSCYNDSISLGYKGSGSGSPWKWSRRIIALPDGQGWDVGVRRTVILDLSQLPGATWGTNEMLKYLTDGELDVFIEDDTIVHSIHLRLYR